MILQTVVEDDPGLEGNLLVERLVGAHVSLVSKEEYVQLGSVVILLSFCPHKPEAWSSFLWLFDNESSTSRRITL